MKIIGFNGKTKFVPEIDESYLFDKTTTKAILAGFCYNRRVMIQGYHGTGKSTHIEQVAARLNWPCVRVNLDSHISRIDLIGKDAITINNGKQVTEFREGILPWSFQNPVALVFDEYTAEHAMTHNCANWFSVPSKYVSESTFDRMVKLWKTSSFDGGRHMTRMSKTLGTK